MVGRVVAQEPSPEEELEALVQQLRELVQAQVPAQVQAEEKHLPVSEWLPIVQGFLETREYRRKTWQPNALNEWTNVTASKLLAQRPQ